MMVSSEMAPCVPGFCSHEGRGWNTRGGHLRPKVILKEKQVFLPGAKGLTAYRLGGLVSTKLNVILFSKAV